MADILKSLYVIGSLRNENIPVVAGKLRNTGLDVFDDWFAAGPEADDFWQKYELSKGSTYAEALRGYAATHVFEFDKHHLDRCDAALLVLPAGKSGHLELGYVIGSGKPGFILLTEEAEKNRFDVMYGFATKVFHNEGEMLEYFEGIKDDDFSTLQGGCRKDPCRSGLRRAPSESPDGSSGSLIRSPEVRSTLMEECLW